MKLRPTIFLSGVSSEFGSFRDAVEVEVQKKGCFAENQSSFGVDYRTVEEMLRRRINDADAVIHIVGFRFGAEPKDRPADKPQRSYTQMEYDIARELEKPVYVFLSSDASICDTPGPDEDLEVTALQLAHRETIKSTNNLRYTFKDKDELRHLAAEIDIVAQADFRVDISRIDRYAPAELIGREQELALLNDAWLKVRRAEASRAHILTFVALGGEGKTSLVAKWLADLAFQNWPGCDSAFAWSFYSQGTREQYAASSDLFLKEALMFFGDATDQEFAASAAGAYEKGYRLARIVGQRRALLILDGLEPLQYAPTSPTPGELKDGGITAFLKGLAARSHGLCIVTTRYSLPNLKAFWQTTAHEIPLTRLSPAAGINLLKTLGVKGSSKEFITLVEDVKGHALTLNLLGTYLRDAHGGDIRRRDLIKLEEADAEEQGGHAFRVLEAYDEALEREGERGKRALAMLRLHGLFDRPITADCLTVLLQEPVIPNLTAPLVGSSDAQRNIALKRLEDAKLITVNWETASTLVSVDAHPLLREYFAKQIRAEASTWRSAHKRLYRHLCNTTPDKPHPSLEDLQPLYQAVAHGSQAGLQEQACNEVYFNRIRRRGEFYSTKKLGAFALDLGAVACFFDIPWSRVSPAFPDVDQAWLLTSASFRLRALGRLTEGLQPLRTGVQLYVKLKEWKQAALNASNLSQLELALGHMSNAIVEAEHALTYADRIVDPYEQIARRAYYADALHQAGLRAEASKVFLEAERIQNESLPEPGFLYSVAGFKYCDLLLSDAERASWHRTLEMIVAKSLSPDTDTNFEVLKQLRAISSRANQTVKFAQDNSLSLLTIALDGLTIGRSALYKSVLSGISSDNPADFETLLIDHAVNGLRRASAQEFIVWGLLGRAWLRFLTTARTHGDSAQEDLDEAWEIAERGPMRLHMADIHLYRARLFFREKDYPWESPAADLAAAEKLINECGYHRRDEELADAKRVILGRSA